MFPADKFDKIKPLDRNNFESIKEKEFKPPYDLFGLKYLRDKAGNERNLRELYRNRAPYELLQNADDADAHKAAFILLPDGLVFAHDGEWFTVDNFRSLADGWSDKDPNQCIGHKGLGFRSVLDITPAPHIIKVCSGEFFGVKFTWALNNGHIQETIIRQPDLQRVFNDWTKNGQLCCPIMAIPGNAKKQLIGKASAIFDALVRGDYGNNFTTMFWFPARDNDINQATLAELSPIPIVANNYGRDCLRSFIVNEVSALIPFLSSISQVKVYDVDRCIAFAEMPATGNGIPPESNKYKKITVLTADQEQRFTRSFFKMDFTKIIPLDVRKLPDTPKAVNRMHEAKYSFLISLQNDKPFHNSNSTFHVYFPTNEATGVGFVIHADFYVKPDRTRLMDNNYDELSYNQWLLSCAAKSAATELLTELLNRYKAINVFDALSPSDANDSTSGQCFKRCFSKELQERNESFIPTKFGLLMKDQVLLPPAVDNDSFWESHLFDGLSITFPNKKAFISATEDCVRTRAFLKLSCVDVLQPESFVDLVEAASKSKGSKWWYDCYSYMSADDKLYRKNNTFFAGRKLIPINKTEVIAVPKAEGEFIISLPPPSDAVNLNVPRSFTSIFVFVDSDLANLLLTGQDTVLSWILDRFHLSRFEATELLPRAVRNTVPAFFSGAIPLSRLELSTIWKFVKEMTEVSRMIKSNIFWEDIGRLPLPLVERRDEEVYSQFDLAPAFLAYFPDKWIEGSNALRQITGIRRVDETFLQKLIDDEKSIDQWRIFLNQVGLSKAPKLLKYARIVQGDDLLIDDKGPQRFPTRGFSGARQNDSNRAVAKVLNEEPFWKSLVKSVPSGGDNSPKIIQNLSLMDGFHQCVEKAIDEFTSGKSDWSERLWALIRDLPLSSIKSLDADNAFCRTGTSGYSQPIGKYLDKQLQNEAWLPSTLGPASRSECFIRFSSKRLISSGVSGEELGDKLIHYLVVNNIDDLPKLQGLGIESLDDVDSASNGALIRFLTILGEQLSSEWGQKEILKTPARWRLVRGAIQEVYSKLNQQDVLNFPRDIKLASHFNGSINFSLLPIYYADPGSPIEQAFSDVLHLFDADRPYVSLLDQLKIIRLQSSGENKTIEETFLAEKGSVENANIRDEIVKKLSQYLLAPIIARTERQRPIDVIVNRLRDRFEVKLSNHLAVSFSVIGNPSLKRDVVFSKFYLQRKIVIGERATEEAHYVLYISGTVNQSFASLDGDALGQTLAPIFFAERINDEIAGLFPRIAYKYQQVNGNSDEMKNFLYNQLGISFEAQEIAGSLILGENVKTELLQPPPLPEKIINSLNGKSEVDGAIDQKIEKHKQNIDQKLSDLIQPFLPKEDTDKNHIDIISQPNRDNPIRGVTPDQQKRGVRGEEEIKRRLKLPSGWSGFIFVEDKRADACGYDFLCILAERQVKLEIKTFAINGRVVVSSSELRAAAIFQNDYYLVGVLDDGMPENQWRTSLVCNPLSRLLNNGEFDIDATLNAPAMELFTMQNEKPN